MSDVATAPDRASGDSDAIRPFRVEVAQADIDDLRQRLQRDALAREGDGLRPDPGRAPRDGPGARALLGR